MSKKIISLFLFFILILLTSFSLPKKSSSIQAVALVNHPTGMLSPQETDGVHEFVTRGLYVPNESKLKKELKKLLGLSFTKENLMLIRSAIVDHFARSGYPFAIVELPPQEVTNGVLQLIVTSAKIGEIHVEGTRWTDKKLIRGYLSAKSGEKIDQRELMGDLDFMNRNPFRSASLIYSPGEERNTTDVTVYSDDRLPVQVYTGVQNTGIDSTGRNRYFVGLSWGRFFGLDHILSYQYTASGDFEEFQGHTVQYLALLSWKHLLNIYGGYSTINNADLPSPNQDNDGESFQASLRYIIPLPTDIHFKHELFFGADCKRMNNNLFFEEQFVDLPKVKGNVNLFQLVLGYKGQYRPGNNVLDYSAELLGSPAEFLPDQSDSDYNRLRPEAENKWIYGKVYLSYLQVLPLDFVIYAAAQGQVTPSTLLPSEQLGIGGYDTVRGYEQRAFNADNGMIFNLEFRTPYIQVLGRTKRKIEDKLQFLAFFDYGWGSQVTPIVHFPSNQDLMGVGPGLRYTLGTNISVRLDWGFRLITSRFIGEEGSRLHFSALISY